LALPTNSSAAMGTVCEWGNDVYPILYHVSLRLVMRVLPITLTATVTAILDWCRLTDAHRNTVRKAARLNST
jgi:hypothetical protein